jgi:replicative DNA helicase
MPDGDIFGLSMRQAPANMAAEQALLGAIMCNQKAYHAVSDFLRQDHFADPFHGRIYAECARRIESGGVADAVSLKTWFESDHDGIKDTSYLSTLLCAMVGIINAKEYGQQIQHAAHLRHLISVGEDLVNNAFANAKTAAEMASEAAEEIDYVIADAGSRHRRTSFLLHEAVDEAIAAGERARAAGGVVGLSTGLPALDDVLGGMEGGGLYILAGRPGMGKSALGVQIAEHNARQGVGTLIVSLEMQAAQLGRRVLSRLSGVPMRGLKRGDWSQSQEDAIVQARRAMQDLPLTIEDLSSQNTQMIAARARAAHRKHGLGLLVIDHLHIVATPASTERMGATWAVGQVSHALKQLAKQMNIPVLALAQLNRGVEGREEKRPTMADLRQSGEIEQDAEAIMLLYRPEYYLPKSEPDRHSTEKIEAWRERVNAWYDAQEKVAGIAEVIIPKVRDGEPGTVKLRFDGAKTSFHEDTGGV